MPVRRAQIGIGGERGYEACEHERRRRAGPASGHGRTADQRDDVPADDRRDERRADAKRRAFGAESDKGQQSDRQQDAEAHSGASDPASNLARDLAEARITTCGGAARCPVRQLRCGGRRHCRHCRAMNSGGVLGTRFCKVAGYRSFARP